ncbi:hypothetical protein MKY34_11995 [Sporosarcina sp. FSL K6-1522]|uniref:hypothetical protein n=1 Tax=Sporosarcina sp. FSL K6-1522 TaxID=2921554 RepID=UPI00315ABB4B
MKSDFRIQYPLWQIGSLLMITLGLFGSRGVIPDLLLALNVNNLAFFEGIIALLFSVLFIGFGITFRIRLSAHNKNHPDRKLAFFQLRPFEYIEDDEGWQFITRHASQKVYAFFSWALPTSLLLHLAFDMPQYGVVINILVLAIMQYLIYYLELRKYVQEDIE